MPQSECPFCNPDPARVFLQAELIVGLWDAFPVAAGHALLVTRRHVASWFDATASERQALTDAIQTARQEILRRHAPDGFNIGVNVGEAAGQTVPHLHRSRHSALPRRHPRPPRRDTTRDPWSRKLSSRTRSTCGDRALSGHRRRRPAPPAHHFAARERRPGGHRRELRARKRRGSSVRALS